MSERFRLRDNALMWRQIEDEVVVLDERSSQYLAVNKTGAVLWPLLTAGASRDELLARLGREFEVDGATAGRDLDSFLAALAEQRLLA